MGIFSFFSQRNLNKNNNILNTAKKVEYVYTEKYMASSDRYDDLIFSKFSNHPSNYLYTIHELSSILKIYLRFLDVIASFQKTGLRSGIYMTSAKYHVFGNLFPNESYELQIMSEKADDLSRMLVAYKCFKLINGLDDDYIHRYRLRPENSLHEIEHSSRGLESTFFRGIHIFPIYDYIKIMTENPENLLSQNHKIMFDYYQNLSENDFYLPGGGYPLYLAKVHPLKG